MALKGLSFAYGDKPVFSGLTLTAQPGDIIECTASVFDLSLVERRTAVRSRFGGSLVTAYRIPVEEA